MPRGLTLTRSPPPCARTRAWSSCAPEQSTGTWFPTVALRAFRAHAGPSARRGREATRVRDDPALESALGCCTSFRTWSSPVPSPRPRPGRPARRLCLRAPGVAGGARAPARILQRRHPRPGRCRAALSDEAHLREVPNSPARARLAGRELAARGLTCALADQFLLVDFGRPAAPVEAALVERGVVPRRWRLRAAGLPAPDPGPARRQPRLLAALDERRRERGWLTGRARPARACAARRKSIRTRVDAGGIAEGSSRIRGFLEARTRAPPRHLAAAGVRSRRLRRRAHRPRRRLHGLRASEELLDCGNAGRHAPAGRLAAGQQSPARSAASSLSAPPHGPVTASVARHGRTYRGARGRFPST